MGISMKNVFAKVYKKFHAEMHLLALKAKDKAKMELSLDIVRRSTSRCRTDVFYSNSNSGA